MNEESMRMKLAYWTGIVKEARSSGMKISEWCDKNQISRRKYYYWHGKVMHDTYTLAVENKLLPETKSNTPEQMLPPAPDFAELPIPQMDPALHEACSDSSIRISCNDFLVMVDPDFSERELMKVLRVMKHV